MSLYQLELRGLFLDMRPNKPLCLRDRSYRFIAAIERLYSQYVLEHRGDRAAGSDRAASYHSSTAADIRSLGERSDRTAYSDRATGVRPFGARSDRTACGDRTTDTRLLGKRSDRTAYSDRTADIRSLVESSDRTADIPSHAACSDRTVAIRSSVDPSDRAIVDAYPVSFMTRKTYNRSPRPRIPAEASIWHLRLGHPGPLALQHVCEASTGVRLRGIPTTECDACGVSKIKRQISRSPRTTDVGPGESLAIDFHETAAFKKGPSIHVMLITDRFSGLTWIYFLSHKTDQWFISVLHHQFSYIGKHYGLKVLRIECDNELVRPIVKTWLHSLHIETLPCAPHAQAQNGLAERIGAVIKDKARAMRNGAHLPTHLMEEIYQAAVYLFNRTPRYTNHWKSPYECFFTEIARRTVGNPTPKMPDQRHLRAYGCKAFAMTPAALKKTNRRLRLEPRAFIGYLVGYQSSNIYRVWLPTENKVISTRDVIFNEKAIYSGNEEDLRDDVKEVDPAMIAHLLKNSANNITTASTGALTNEEASSMDEDYQVPLYPGSHLQQPPEEAEEGIEAQGMDGLDVSLAEEAENIPAMSGTAVDLLGIDPTEGSPEAYPYLTPPDTPSSDAFVETRGAFAILNAAIQEPLPRSTDTPAFEPQSRRKGQPKPNMDWSVWRASFMAGTQGAPVAQFEEGVRLDRAAIERRFRKGHTIKRRELPPLPKHHDDLKSHPMGLLFEEAERAHIDSHKEMRSWYEVSAKEPRKAGKQVLDCMWVYIYKTDSHNRFQRCKARLVVRGDQQQLGLKSETYAATLAGRSFRTLMAISARFDLDLIQYDAVNAFVNVVLDEEVYMRMPPGYRRPGTVLHLYKALYGLRRSPYLWQKRLTSVLHQLGFQTIPHEPCCMTMEGILIFFYVDDIVLASPKGKTARAREIMKELNKTFKLTGGGDLQWFLGVEVIRNRDKRLIWLSQAAYVSKIQQLVPTTNDARLPDFPMTKAELLPHQGRASYASINSYQRKCGSVLYAAVISRPDIAFAVSRIARHSINPSEQHHEAVNRLIRYLDKTRHYALRFGGEDDFVVASDASFADNTLDRKSSQAYAMKLFGGLIGWRANKQTTVTTSTTEAELLALSQAAKESIFVSHLIKELGVTLDDQRIQIQCDNTATVRLVESELPTLNTKLRHVDIHNHWLRQEAQNGRITVKHTRSAELMADGLTKALGKARH